MYSRREITASQEGNAGKSNFPVAALSRRVKSCAASLQERARAISSVVGALASKDPCISVRVVREAASFFIHRVSLKSAPTERVSDRFLEGKIESEEAEEDASNR